MALTAMEVATLLSLEPPVPAPVQGLGFRV